MKKVIPLILALVLLLTSAVIPSAAAQALPESEHDYANNQLLEWVWTEPGAAGLFVTFAPETYIDPGIFGGIDIKVAKSGEVTVGDVYKNIIWGPLSFGDTLYIYGKDDVLVGSYDGAELSGKRIFVPGDTLRIVLDTDDSDTAWGFKVTSITPVYAEDMRTVTYHSCRDDLSDYTDDFYAPTGVKTDSFYAVSGWGEEPAGVTFAGWAGEENGAVLYDGGETIGVDSDTDIDLYAVWAPLVLSEDEVFYFTNSSWYLDVEGDDTYYITKEDFNRIQSNIYRVYGLGPIPSVALSIVLLHYRQFDFNGSCYGMSTCVALQHLGKIDLLSQQDYDTVRELDATPELVSTINYYQTQAATSWLTENKGYNPGDTAYRVCLRGLYDSASAGNLCMLTFYEDKAFTSAGHTVLVTGAYDNAAGEHVLIVYDCNRPGSYREGSYSSRFYISPDWSTIRYSSNGEPEGAINWTDNFEQFESFDLAGQGSILHWYKAYFSHIADILRQFKSFFDMISAK